MSENFFYFISGSVKFQESSPKGALIEATVLELEKESEGPMHNVYEIEDGPAIAKSLIGKEVYYGVDPFLRHENPFVSGKDKEPVGVVETAKVVGNRIKATIRIIAESLIETLKRGTKYLFSVGGIAISETVKKVGDKIIHVLHGARCNHLQIVDASVPVGFPNAKMEKLIEINETVMVCEGALCHCVGRPSQAKRKMKIADNQEIFIVGDSGVVVESIEIE